MDDDYYFINDEGVVCHEIDTNDEIDNYRYNAGIYGRTKQELEAKLKYNVARQVLLDDAEGGKYFLGENKWYAFYSMLTLEWTISMNTSYHPGVIYFRNRKSLEKSLEEHEKQWEIVRKYEMGEDK